MKEKTYVIQDREPAVLYHYFEDISAIPRISYNEAAAAAYVIGVAREHGLWYYEDEIHNVLVRRPGSKGCEHLPSVLLEGHLDIVGEKTEDSTHNFETDPLELIEEGNILHANKTTLGADNGCAVALMLTLLTDKNLIAPPLECLFTVQEEVGLFGAKHFDASLLQSRRVIGLDAGAEGVFRMGTSTKFEMTSLYPAHREKVHGVAYHLIVDGLKGGDQGAGIPQERICAIKMTARILHYLNKVMDVRVVSMDKLGKSIPESCDSHIVLAEGDENLMLRMMEEQQRRIRIEHEDADPDIRICVERETAPETMLTKEDSNRLIEAIYLMPYGARNRKLDRMDEVSCSVIMKKIYTKPDGIRIFSVISTEEMENGEALDEEMQTYMMHWGFIIESEHLNRGWQWSKESAIREIMVKTYEQLFGKKPKVNISHGGNDCVVLKEKIPELDMVTTAATYVDYHTPRERLYMDTFEKVYALVRATLENLAKEAEKTK